MSEAARRDKVQDVYNQLEADGMRILQETGSVLKHCSQTQIRNDPSRVHDAIKVALRAEEDERP
jgi:hypothetical protein